MWAGMAGNSRGGGVVDETRMRADIVAKTIEAFLKVFEEALSGHLPLGMKYQW